MNDDLQRLKRDYQAISAPPHLATRVAASVADSRTRTGFWMPAAVACTAILALIWVLPITNQVTQNAVDKPSKPSLSALAALKPNKPTVATPSMSQLRSVSVPRMPTKPKPVRPAATPTNLQIQNDSLEEKTHVYI